MSTFVRTSCDEGVVLGAGGTTPCERVRGRWILVVAILGSGMAFADDTVVNIVLPTLQSCLGASVTAIQWVVEARTLVLASLMPVGGALLMAGSLALISANFDRARCGWAIGGLLRLLGDLLVVRGCATAASAVSAHD